MGMKDTTEREKKVEQIALAAIDEIRMMQNRLTMLTYRLETLLPQGPRPPRKKIQTMVNGKMREF